jgi:twinkle protein
MDFKSKLQSLQQTLNVSYTRPDIEKFNRAELRLRGSPDDLDAQRALDYLMKERGLTRETIDHFRLGYDPVRDAIAIPHFKNGELINIKYRYVNPKDVRYTSEPNAEQYYFNEAGMETALSKGAVAIAEGEFDCMSLWQAGFKNVISPGSGANSFGSWIEVTDKLRQVWIAYDNDAPGQAAARELADRIGMEKCRNVVYPEGTKDANDFIRKFESKDLRELFSKATPFYKYEFSGVQDVISRIINDPMDYLEVRLLPGVRLEKDQLIVLSGNTNAGKSTIALNIIHELATRNIPSLFMPFERGVYSLGRRYVQIALGKTQEQMQFTPKEEWERHALELSRHPVYLAVPEKHNILDTISRARRLFGVKLVVIDHLDYLIRNVNGNRENAISDTVQGMKRLAEKLGIIVIIVTHVRKIDDPGSEKQRKPNLDDLKGSSSLKQDPEVVAMLYPTQDRRGITVDILKNKGPMMARTFEINNDTGVVGEAYDPNNY